MEKSDASVMSHNRAFDGPQCVWHTMLGGIRQFVSGTVIGVFSDAQVSIRGERWRPFWQIVHVPVSVVRETDHFGGPVYPTHRVLRGLGKLFVKPSAPSTKNNLPRRLCDPLGRFLVYGDGYGVLSALRDRSSHGCAVGAIIHR